ncbi:hypothetical protein POTOM_017305 [Populus tomentosa]|uniref:Cytokinin hydroxylase-like n=1 Tax=Populus tomentosa TaxID=118781 RepID=A0A8X8A064_POPTO|nr:hypothetical protein POTOM_017305 [Populus tomentosa]
MAVMMLVLTSLLVIFIFSFLKVAYDTISCYFLTPRRIKKIMEKQGVRGPKPRPLTGNILDVAAYVSKSTSKDMDQITHDTVNRLLPHYVAWSKQYGKRFIFWNGVEPRLCISETEMIKELLTKYSTKSGKSWLQREGTKHFIGRGLLMANGSDWYHQRHIAAPSFMGERLKSKAGLMVECTKNMLQSLQNAVESGQTEVEIGEYMSRVTADIISRTQFGSSYEKGKQIFHLLTELQSLCHQATRHLCLPGSRFFPSNYNRQIKSKKMEVDRLLLEIIQSRKDCLNMVVSESLRLYPSGTLLPRMAFEDIKLGDLDIPKGLQIWIPVLAIHHSEELWGKDANEFNPDRFASKSFAPGRHFIPFAAGPRNCIGQSFAMMEAKIILAMLISQFSFNISDSYRHAPVVVLTIKPKYGVQVYLKPLNS